MQSTAKTDVNEVVSVVDGFDYSTQNETYNSEFKKWRKNSNNPFGFRFKKNSKEAVFVDGRGFVDNSIAEAEQERISRIFYVIGVAALIWVVVEDFAGKLMIAALGTLGINVNTDFFSSVIYGGGAEIVTALLAITMLKILLPAYFVHKKMALPRRVELMSRMNDPAELVGAIGMALLVCTAVSLPEAYSSETHEIYSFFNALTTDVSVWDQSEFIIYTFFDVVIVSIMKECFFRGAMFAALRQFGDPFALIMTSVTAALLTQDVREMPAVLLISLVAGFGMLRSGSLFTAAAVQVIYKMYLLALAILEGNTSDKMLIMRNAFMLAAGIAGAAAMLCVLLSKKRRGKTKLAVYRSEQKEGERILAAVRTFPYSIVMGICLLYAVIRAVV